jgi:hypothetical protein
MRLAVTQGVLVLYPFLWLKLYQHVFKQRKSKLGKGSRKKRAWENLALLSSAQLSCHLLLSCETLTGHCGFLFWKKIFELLSDATVKVLLNRAVIGLRFGFSVCFNCSAFYVCINIHQAYIIVMLLLRV